MQLNRITRLRPSTASGARLPQVVDAVIPAVMQTTKVVQMMMHYERAPYEGIADKGT